jgi:hypothetical protein
MEHFSFRTLYAELNWQSQLRMLGGPFQMVYAPTIDTCHDVLLPLLDDSLRAMEPLRAYGDIEARLWRKRKTGLAYNDPHAVNLWQLYALSRVSDLLLVPFTPVGDTATFSPCNET